MKKLSLLLITLMSSVAVWAQSTPTSREIVVNTDQDKVAEVERHAQELKDKQDAAINSAEPTAAGPKHKAKRHHKKATKTDQTQPLQGTQPEDTKVQGIESPATSK
ncbi:hypothetical protein [Aquabacterium sp.]|uniref:hypothetical protein n=1 Tax=Aquabacterium sp. TaxID=1872578 RepID=UPI003D6C7EB4